MYKKILNFLNKDNFTKNVIIYFTLHLLVWAKWWC